MKNMRIGARSRLQRVFPLRATIPALKNARARPRQDHSEFSWRSRFIEGSATALGSVTILGLAGYAYNQYYKYLVLHKMETAFSAGYSTLEEASLARQTQSPDAGCTASDETPHNDWIRHPDQALISQIVSGNLMGQYYLLVGAKGTGKTSLLLSAMEKERGDGVATMEAHGDLEVFRLRLGKALNYEFHEDYIGGLFSFRGPRDATPLLDIERAFNKMEKIALKRRARTGKPLVLIINRAHLLRDDTAGQNLLDVLQQRAELWAASKLVTVVLNSDEYWIEERLVPQATRLQIIPINDISEGSTKSALRAYRTSQSYQNPTSDLLDMIYNQLGGRLRFLIYVWNEPDMVQACDFLRAREKRWFLNQCWIYGEEMDDDAEDQQEFCAAAMVLAKALVDLSQKTGERRPRIPLHEARQIMTREDFIRRLDHLNIFFIDSESMVQADSMLMQKVFEEVCSEEGFGEHLEATQRRLDELESLGRTNEVTFKDEGMTAPWR